MVCVFDIWTQSKLHFVACGAKLYLKGSEPENSFRRLAVTPSGGAVSAASQAASNPVQSALLNIQDIFLTLLGSVAVHHDGGNNEQVVTAGVRTHRPRTAAGEVAMSEDSAWCAEAVL